MALEQLKAMTVVVADTGDFESELNIYFLQVFFQVSVCLILSQPKYLIS
jgi:hypothetical protein